MKKSRMADGLLKGLTEAVQMEQGKLIGREKSRSLSRPAPKWSKTEIKRLRTEVFHMSQPLFASLLNVSLATIRAWEQGQRIPDGAAARLMEILAKNQKIAQDLAA